MAEEQSNQRFRQRQQAIIFVLIAFEVGIGYLIYTEQFGRFAPSAVQAPSQNVISLSLSV